MGKTQISKSILKTELVTFHMDALPTQATWAKLDFLN